ncbi:MAG: helix-turn-helix transcriptional regulator [Actinobacteria bacterium]|nr:helix-turn-helix transcriptional regulator [Actinomycetota bacterium]MBI3686450.1 helix-turn-helix transcriptional regulator [Actinomycetota bacterium]
METGAIGKRVRYWRDRRGLTRRHFADLVGRSSSWVDKIESGERHLDRLSVLDQVANALNVPLQVLLDDDAFRLRAQCVDAPEAAAIRMALQQWTPAAGPPHPATDTAATAREPELRRLRRQVTYAWLAFQSANYATLGSLLAALVTDTQHARDTLVGDDAATATAMLAQVYQIITSTVRKLGHVDLEWVAADRAMRCAEQIGDVTLYGGAAFRLVNAIRDNNGAPAAVTATRATADHLRHHGKPATTPQARSLYGHLMLQGAMAAAAADDASSVAELLREAEHTAEMLGTDRNDFYTAFGPTNVTIHEVAALVELREWRPALAVTERLSRDRLAALPKERRANHLLDLARAHSLGGHRDEATWSLLEADALAPNEIRCRPVARDLVADLVRRSRTRPSFDLQRLAARVGVPA